MRWIKSRLAIRQTAYAVLVVALLGSAITTFEIVSAYEKELNRLQRFSLQLGEAFSKTAARAAFHVDQAQAESVLEGLMNFENVSAAQINTDLGDILGARSRTFTPGFMDPLSRWLFGDVSSNRKTLVTSMSRVPVGTLTLTVSPEQSGRGFIGTLGTNLSGLAIEFILLTSTLAFIFHLSLVKPLTAYTTEIEAINHDSLNIPDVGVPVGHETDELGQMVLKTNQLISRIAEQREALIHREKIAALGTMLTSAAHELNNPLAVISAQTQILKETSDDPAIIARADRILRPVERCARIIQSFLEIARQRKLEKKPMRIEDAIGDAVELVDYQFESQGVTLKVAVQDDMPVMTGDTTQISQAIMNLLLNAQQAIVSQPLPHTIELLVSRTQDTVIISVIDNGPGIPEEVRHRIFEPFFTTKAKGTGLGLSFCHNVAIAHGGELTITPAESQGSIATLKLPIEEAEFPEEKLDAAIHSKRLKILVVDDEAEITATFSEALTLRGHEVEVDMDGESALKRIKETLFDVVVADIRMPGMTGIELYQQASSRFNRMEKKFVFISGEPLSDSIRAFLDLRSTPCLVKPVDIEVLTQAIERRSTTS